MNMTHKSFLKVALGIASTLTLGLTLMAQTPDVAQTETRARVPLVTDWSHKNLVFSAPKSVEQSRRLQQDPRFMQQYYRRAMTAMKPLSDPGDSGPRYVNPTLPARWGDHQAEPESGPMHRDWTAALGASASVGNEQFPAKYSFNVNATPNCTSDFVAYNTNTASGTGATGYSTKAIDYGFFWNIPAVGSTIQINGTTFTAISNTTAVSSLHFQQGSSPSQAASNFVTAVNAATSGIFTYTAQVFFGNWVIVTDTVAGSAGNNSTVGPSGAIDCFPFFFGSCSNSENFTWFFPKFIGGNGGTSTAAANLVALNNLYSTCGSGPSTYFAYGVSTSSETGGTTASSVALSMDGTKIAFVVSTSTGSNLHILKWAAGAGSITAPATPTTATSSTWSTCTNCQLVLPMGSHSSSNSAPFADYWDDVIYVGDDNGTLYKYTGVFLGTSPSKTWSITVDSGAKLTGPVYDNVSGNVIMADSKGCVSYVTTSTTPVAHDCVIPTGGNPIPDPPIVDSNTEMVLVFVGNNGAGNAEIIQATVSLTDPTSLGVGAAGAQMHSGDFDNNYYSGDMAQGHLYYCGKQPTMDLPTIRRITFDAYGDFIGSDTNQLQVGTTPDSECSPLTEVYNNGMDLMFFGVTAGGNGANCDLTGQGQTNSSGGCLMSIDVTLGDSATDAFPTAVAASLGEPGGTSGIVIDNVVSASSTSGSSVYFTPLAVGTTNGVCTGDQGCAVKATQNGLN
jgi:hypothetical protein